MWQCASVLLVWCESLGGKEPICLGTYFKALDLMGINIVKVEMKESLIVTAEKHPRTNTTN